MAQKHIKNYMKHFDIGIDDVWQCEACGRQFRINNGLEIHHIIFRSHGGSDDIKNLCCLCVKCHRLVHEGKLNQSDIQYIHNSFLQGKTNFIK